MLIRIVSRDLTFRISVSQTEFDSLSNTWQARSFLTYAAVPPCERPALSDLSSV